MSNRPEKINLSDVHSRQVDIDLLNELRDLFVKAEEQKERYDFTWNGKAKAYFEAAAPTTKTLRVQPEESVNFEKSENLFITGDNLEALKLLQESYLGKIDMIYLDPPYNTGNDFVYQDNFKKTQKENDLSEGSIDEDGDRLVKNEKSNGRYHSDWLTMMYPRLKLARNLLSDSGVIFVSIDDNEQANLKILMDEIFGSSSYVGMFPWRKRTAKSDVPFGVSQDYEYILTYAMNDFRASVESENSRKYYETEDFPNRPWRIHDMTKQTTAKERPNSFFTMKNPRDGMEYPADPNRTWRITKDTFKTYLDKDEIVFPGDYDFLKISKPQARYFKENDIKKDGIFFGRSTVSTKLPDSVGFTGNGNKDIMELFDDKVFSFPKPVNLIKYLIQIATYGKENSIILDAFSGSGTTAQATITANLEDGYKRKFIAITLPEKMKNSHWQSIDNLSRERIRRAAEKIGDKSGFRALKVDSTGLKEDVFKTAGELDQVDLLKDIDNHSDNRSDYDLLYDVLVDGALEYNRPIVVDTIHEEKIIKYDYLGELSGVICYFGENLTDELTRKIAIFKPLIAVFKESTFDKSAQKVNVMEQFRIISPDTKVKVI
ncbi:site-specific DNA-methyltransferase [Enterococcus gallinarum]|uniref:site-specific DNA-methyltransferase n=1 Tax=Enterococcus gallinarum TaxID=1353 RepID=UPI002DBD0AC7|nr:site-specific DNA-methyltransferase [Enterococcus gallinarum]MEB5857837.1 site-specific DNA-methyltransferase [Enterococcus gallinarum]